MATMENKAGIRPRASADEAAPSLGIYRKSGRTPPLLLLEMRQHDPRILSATSFNLFRDNFTPFDENDRLPSLQLKGSCEHGFLVKPYQTSETHIAMACYKCRIRCTLEVENSEKPCPSDKYPFHFLVLDEARGRFDQSRPGTGSESYDFRCMCCDTKTRLHYLPPIFTESDVKTLTSKELIQERATAALKAHPDRLQGTPTPSPSVVVDNLRRYVANVLNGSSKKPVVAFTVKRFQMSFGPDGENCADLLKKIGFEKSVDPPGWAVPQMDQQDEYPFETEQNRLLDDLEIELRILLLSQPQAEREEATTNVPGFDDAIPSLLKMLRTTENQNARPQTTGITVNYFKHLGIPSTIDDGAATRYYELQIKADPERASYYLRCLQRIGKVRTGFTIPTFVVAQNQNGIYTDTEIAEAYRYFGLPTPFGSHEDETVIGTFRARLLDDPVREDMMRKHLLKIGLARNSETIKAVAEDRIVTYEQALDHLGVVPETSDDFVLSSYTSRASESAKSAESARKALEIIADERGSEALHTFLKTGSIPEPDMDIGQAYGLFSIDDRTIDDDIILAVFESFLADAPGRIEESRRALAAIAKDRGSVALESYLCGGQQDIATANAETPVGLDNIGNTCYLNSLLQYLFTVKPFREMILSVENFLEPDVGVEKIVGSRKVTRKEVERSQKFVLELKKLFQDMTTSPRSSVEPTRELARLTLLSSSFEEQIRRQSTVSGNRPSLGDINGQPIQGPAGPPVMTESSELVETPVQEKPPQADGLAGEEQVKDSAAEVKKEADAMSEDTLVNEDVDMKDASQISVKPEPADMEAVGEVFGPVGPPERPPPVPPRPGTSGAAASNDVIKDELLFGAQQDMPEVLGNILFQVSCAIRGNGQDESGEQLDKVKELFYGKMKSYILEPNGKSRATEQFFCDVKINMSPQSNGPEDIYTTLSSAFDAEDITINDAPAKRYSVLSKFPPVLQLQVQRVQYDAVKKSAFKASEQLQLRETIYLDRYLDFEAKRPQLAERRKQVWEWKAELADLRARKEKLQKHSDPDATVQVGPENGLAALKYLQTICEEDGQDGVVVHPETVASLEQLAAEAAQEVQDLESQIQDLSSKISSQFTDLRHMPYRLHTVFMHRGSHLFGHYWAFIYDFERDVWRKYNDGYVNEVKDVREIFEPGRNGGTGAQPTTYCAVYVHDQLKPKIVSAVNRCIEPEIAPALPPRHINNNSPVSPPAAALQPQSPPNWGNTAGPAVDLDAVITGTNAAPFYPGDLEKKGTWNDSSAHAPSGGW